jgi:hypothetical protein
MKIYENVIPCKNIIITNNQKKKKRFEKEIEKKKARDLR